MVLEKNYGFLQMWPNTKKVENLNCFQTFWVEVIFSKFWQKHLHFFAQIFEIFMTFFS